MKRYTRILLVCAILTLLFQTATVFGATSAAKNRKRIKTRTEKFMKAAKSYDIKKMGQNIVSTSTYNVIPEPMGKAVRYMNKKHMKYSIDKISIKGRDGSAKVKVTYFDGYDVFKKAFKSTISWYAKNRSASTEKIQNKIYSYACTYYNKASKKKSIKTATMTIKLKHYSSGWLIVSFSDNYAAAINANYTTAYNAVFKK